MCGIAGFAGTGDFADIRRMTDALAHRGPDGHGFHTDDAAPVFLGHRRLSIVDLETGAQPMWDGTHEIGVIFNGEIYNHLELRRELETRGHKFLTDHSDTEVLVHGYREWGEGLPARLNGMFAFAVYDRRKRQFFLARDRFGEKPLYYTHRNGLFAFASELTALAGHRGVDRTLDVRALQKFFAYGYLPSPHAMFRGSHKLPGGHFLTYDVSAGRLTTGSYWTFRIEPDESLTDRDENRLVDECAALIDQAARRRLMSDVPLGVFLSGGIDSSTILATLTQTEASVRSFTIGFTEPSFDESVYARRVAEYLHTAHSERLLDLDGARDLIPEVLSRIDEPLGDASLLPTYLLSRFTRESVKVALSGDGGDELFAGYDPFLALHPAKLYAQLMPAFAHGGMRRLVDLLPISHTNMSLDFKLRRTLTGLSYDENIWLPVWMSPLDPKDLNALFEMPVRAEDVYDEAIELWESGPDHSAVDKALEFFTRFYLQDDILVKSDRAAMMCSLEARAVFLDNDLVEFCRKLPNRFKFRNGERKYLLKKVARRMLPSDIVDRRKKGFGIPLGQWLREVPEQPPLSPIAGVRTGFARTAFQEHRAGKRDRRLFLWGWLSAQAFAQRARGGADLKSGQVAESAV